MFDVYVVHGDDRPWGVHSRRAKFASGCWNILLESYRHSLSSETLIHVPLHKEMLGFENIYIYVQVFVTSQSSRQ